MGNQAVIEPIEVIAKVVLTGKSPLVMHNPQSADEENLLKIEIDSIIAMGRQMTPEDRKRKEALQWMVSLYTDQVKEDGDKEPSERVIVPMTWLLPGVLEEGGKTLGIGIKSKGAAVIRSVTQTETQMVLDYNGPQDIRELAADPRFRWRTMVCRSGGRKKTLVSAVRPVFPEWEVTTTLSVVTSMGLSWDDFMKASHAAGNIGIGDAKKLGYGRFRVKITKMR